MAVKVVCGAARQLFQGHGEIEKEAFEGVADGGKGRMSGFAWI